jgi:uncharacterized membrane protein
VGTVAPLQPDFELTKISRISVLAASASLFAVGFRISPWAGSAPSLAVSLTTYLLAFALAGVALAGKVTLKNAVATVAASMTFAVVVLVAHQIVFEIPTYGTDVMSFAHAGGEALLQGENPYTVTIEDVRPTLNRIGYRDSLTTQTRSGEPLNHITYYPALHVLTFTGFLAIGLQDLRWATLIIELVTIGIIWSAVSTSTRLLLPFVLLLEPYLSSIFTAGGNSDWLWTLPVAVSALFLHRRRWSWAGFWLGIACAVKQQPWFAIPFVLVWVIKSGEEHDRRSRMLEFPSMLALGFVLPNFPFMLWSFTDWFKGVLGPALTDLVADGQGLTQLVVHGWVSVSPVLFGVTLSLVVLALTGLYFVRFERLKNLLWILPPFALFFAYRSLHSYFVYWIPIVLLWLDLTNQSSSIEGWSRPWSRLRSAEEG